MRRFEGRTAIVTGATMGIGEATARRLAAEGARVVLVARGAERGEALAAELGGGAVFVAGDVADPRTAAAAVVAAGELDVLVNNAGIDHSEPLLEADLDHARAVFETNVHGALSMLVAAARSMRDSGRGGSIVNVTSRLAVAGVPTLAVYSASKGALLSLTRTAAVELAPHRIRVNAVAPGLTRTQMVTAWVEAQPDPSTFEASVAQTIPQARFAEPEEVAAAIVFLAAPEAGHITGASIAVDGGYTAA